MWYRKIEGLFGLNRRRRKAKYENDYSGGDIGTYSKQNMGNIIETPVFTNGIQYLTPEEPANRSNSSIERVSDRVLLTASDKTFSNDSNGINNRAFTGGSDMYTMPNKKIYRNNSVSGSSEQQVDYDEYWRTKI